MINKTIYIGIGLAREGHKELLGVWLRDNESVAFCQEGLTDLKTRGEEDILVTATDHLNGCMQSIKNVFPTTDTQTCVVHQIRHSARYVARKDKKVLPLIESIFTTFLIRKWWSQELERFAKRLESQISVCDTFFARSLGRTDRIL